MGRVVVEPSDKGFRLTQMVEPASPENRELLEGLVVRQIEVDCVQSSWSVFLDAADWTSWSRLAQKIQREDLDAALADLRQELRKKVPGLEQVQWVLPENVTRVLGARPAGKTAKNGSAGRWANGSSKAPPSRKDAVPLSQVTGGEKGKVTVCGEIVEVTWKQSQGGQWTGTIILTDRTDSITVRLVSQDSKAEDLVPGTWILLRGQSGIDRFDNEPAIVVVSRDDICIVEPEIRMDPALRKRTELHLHTKMSQMDSVLDVAKAVERASKWGMKALAVTDHGVVQAFPEAYEAGKKHGVKIIYGLEAYLVPDDDTRGTAHHAIILVKNPQGLLNLYELVTASHLEYFYRVPRIPRSLLASKREGLLIGSACEAGEVYRAVLAGRPDSELKAIASFYDYLEIQPLDNNAFLIGTGPVRSREDLAAINRKIYELAREMGIPCVMTSDAHYLDPEDEIYRSILLSGKGMEDGEKPAPVYFRTTQEMIEEASGYLGEQAAVEVVVDNTAAIADQCKEFPPVKEGSYFPSLDGAEELLRDLAEAGARRRYGPTLPQVVRERLDKELSAIIGNGFASLYVIAIKMVEESRKKGYLVGSRGSVGSSLVATCTGITEVNPLPPHYVCPNCYWSDFSPGSHYGSGFDLPRKACPQCGAECLRDGQDIPFETFMGFRGEKVPDIDLNFSGEIQSEMFKFAQELLGEGNVFRAGTIGTIARKTAFGFVKHYAQERGKTFRRAEEIRLACGIEGVKRTTGQHPGGVMVIPRGMNVLEFTPLQYPADDRSAGSVTTHFDYNSLSGHLVKVDILGHDDPTVLKMLHELTGVDPTTIPMDDPETLKLFSGESPDDAVGIPEFGTRFVRGMLAETRPRTFADLVRISGLSHGTDVWANNARDIIRNNVASLSEVIATREDIFLFLMAKGMEPARAFGIAEKVRKGKPLSEDDISEMKKVRVPDWYIESCKKITYLFPKAHAAAYVTTAFRIAYFKVHYPVAFAAAYFTFHGSSLTTDLMYLGESGWKEYIERVNSSPQASAKEEDVASALEVAMEMSRRGVTFGRPSLYESDATRYIPRGNTLIPPFVAIPGLGNQAAQAIVAERKQGKFTSVEDFRRRTGLGRKTCEILKAHGVLEGLPEGEQLSLFS